MAKRRLTKRQISRISAKQRKANQAIDNTLDEAQLDAETSGFVVAHFGTQVLIQSSTNPTIRQRCHFRANTETLVVGDNVRWQSGEELGVVNARLPRNNVLERPGHRGHAKAVVANIDILAIVVAAAPPVYRHLIDRYLVAAHAHNMRPIIIANKADIPVEKRTELIAINKDYSALGYNVVEVSTKQASGLDNLKSLIAGKNLMLAGQSGVGKSSLTNVLVPDANMQIGELSHAAEKGKHTTTASHWFAMECGGGLIDSPGIREFGINHLDPSDIISGFIECAPHTEHCQFRDCSHINAKGCALLAAAAEGKVSQQRLESFQHLYKEAQDALM